ncbi:DUF3466 family protein [uncultured Rhodospira sp.]|uniref:DUF3466 family protein n=1 Tax=uncultured Rhodospira sp. TaxID=1936189 RepID=UPI0026150180|nr:DUF3466 family protein [uncultured Rhodospira sp.]
MTMQRMAGFVAGAAMMISAPALAAEWYPYSASFINIEGELANAIVGDGRRLIHMNDSEQIVGLSHDGSNWNAFFWDENSGSRYFGENSHGYYNSNTRPYGINNSGQVVGHHFFESATRPTAFLWDEASGMQNLGTLSTGPAAYAMDVNESGDVVGWSDVPDSGDRAFLWKDGHGMQNLGTMDTDSANADIRPVAINNSGQVAGRSTVSGAFVWDENNGMRRLGSLPGGRQYDTFAYDINNNGQIVGAGKTFSEFSHSGLGDHAFIWDEANGIRDIGNQPEISNWSLAYAINDNGQVVGRAGLYVRREDGGGTNEKIGAFLWDETTGMRYIDDMIDPSLGIFIGTAIDINNNGAILGWGWGEGAGSGYFLLRPNDPLSTVPLPAAVWFMLTGLGGLFGARWLKKGQAAA